MKLRLFSRGERKFDDRVAQMLDRHVREQHGSAPIVLKKTDLTSRLELATATA